MTTAVHGGNFKPNIFYIFELNGFVAKDMSQSDISSFYGLRKNIRTENAKNIESRNIKYKNVSAKDKKLVKNEGHINAKRKKLEPQEKILKRVAKTAKPSSKKESNAETKEVSKPKVTSFYESNGKCMGNDNALKDLNFSSASEEILQTVVCSTPHKIAGKAENCEGSSKETPTKIKFKVPGNNLNPRFFPKKLCLEFQDEVFESSETSRTKLDKIPFQFKSAVRNFQEKKAKIKSYASNPCKVTSMITPAKEIETKSSLPNVPAYQRYRYLADPNISSSLILPYQYKKLSEIYQSFDTAVSILHNRKEKINFDKVQEDVQKMKKNISKTELGQIVNIVPAAFGIKLKKCNIKNANEPKYDLVLSPNVKGDENSNKALKSSKFVTITQQHLLNRKVHFDENLLQRVHYYHQIFLSHQHIPPVAIERIKRWHPKFSLNSIPNIEVATLPENKSIEVSGTLQEKGKKVKAFKEVAENSPSNKSTEIETANLKEVYQNLITKIQAVKSTHKLLECAERSLDQRKAMLERLPQIMQIVWHYFIVERKGAVLVDTAVEKIIHSFNSVLSHEEAKSHLSLIAEEFPGWLSFIQVPKGLYITMDKSKNLNEMLRSF